MVQNIAEKLNLWVGRNNVTDGQTTGTKAHAIKNFITGCAVAPALC